MKITIILIPLLTLIGCNVSSQNNEHLEIELANNFSDTCISLKDGNQKSFTINREFEIIKNTFKDTLNIGFNKISPGTLGTYYITQIDTFTDRALYAPMQTKATYEDAKNPERLTKFLCVYNMGPSPQKGKVSHNDQKLILRVRKD